VEKIYNEFYGHDPDYLLTTPIGIDSQSAIDTANSFREIQRTRHIARRFHFVRFAIGCSQVPCLKSMGPKTVRIHWPNISPQIKWYRKPRYMKWKLKPLDVFVVRRSVGIRVSIHDHDSTSSWIELVNNVWPTKNFISRTAYDDLSSPITVKRIPWATQWESASGMKRRSKNVELTKKLDPCRSTSSQFRESNLWARNIRF
jgi:hypothetical protein